MESNVRAKVAELKVIGEERLEISDVKQIISSTNHEVIAKTISGAVLISGFDLTISKLIPEGGLLSISGQICGIKFDNKQGGKSFLKRVFK